ncbi:MAG: PKD domain-containing protein, partial [Catenulispora sp.]
MGNQNKPSPARKRLSQLAVTTTLAAVGVGVVGTGAASAATPASTPISQGNETPAAATNAALVVTPGTGADSLMATADLAGTAVSSTAHASVTINWGETAAADMPVAIDSGTGLPTQSTLTHDYAMAGKYTVTLTVDDGTGAAAQVKTADVTVSAPMTVAAPVLKAAVSTANAAKGSPVWVSLTGSSVDKTATAAKTTITWGDKTTDSVLPGDPSKVAANDGKLSHAYAAIGSYPLTVKLDDGLGTKDSV